MCNAYTLSGTLVSCDFPNPADCPSYTLPYADLNANLLCAIDVAFVNAIKTHKDLARLSIQWAQKEAVEAIACIVQVSRGVFAATSECNLASLVSLQSQLSQAMVWGCFTYEATVQAANVAAMVAHYAFDGIYAMVVDGGGPAYNRLQMAPAELARFVQVHHVDPLTGAPSYADATCAQQANEAACYLQDSKHAANGAGCQWNGARCAADSYATLHFQPFPLEAATTTLLVAAFSPLFWAQYMFFMQAQRLATIVDFSTATTTDVAAAIGAKIAYLAAADQYYVVLDEVRVVTLAVRDAIVAMVEVLRAVVWVVNGCVGGSDCAGTAEFVAFETTLMDLVSLPWTSSRNSSGSALQSEWLARNSAKLESCRAALDTEGQAMSLVGPGCITVKRAKA